jgi:MoaA/NifB/PqqE/SkfB family radical SAM enzyme
MKQQPTVIWELTRACELQCLHCPHPSDRSRSPRELTTFEAYCLVNQIVQLSPKRFVMSGGDPLARGDVYQLVDHARRRGLNPVLTISPTANATTDAITRLRRNGLSRIIVPLEGASADSHDASRGIPGSYRRTLHIIGTALCSGIDVEVNTLVTRENLGILDAIYDRIERLGVVAWNVYLPVPHAGVRPLNEAEISQVSAIAERLRVRGLTEIRIMDPGVSTVFITSEGQVRNGEFVTTNSGDLRRDSLTQICRSPY